MGPQRSEVKTKSVRRALRDVSNNNGGGIRSSRTTMTTSTKKFAHEQDDRPITRSQQHQQEEKEEEEEEQKEDHDDDSLDRLLLVQSDLSALLNQIDELVVQAFEVKSKSKQGRKEVESFAHVLSQMVSSLKPWVPRFQKVLASGSSEFEIQSRSCLVSQTVSAVNEAEPEAEVVESPEKANLNLLISPSPLVSWRANCTVERGRQLFLLTPIPISKAPSSKNPDPPKSLFKRVASDTFEKLPSLNSISIDENHDLLNGVEEVKPTPIKPFGLAMNETSSTLEGGSDSPQMFLKSNRSVVVMTPCFKRSPPKSCALLEAITESSHVGCHVAHKSTPFPVGHKNYSDSESSSGSEASQGLALKYPELLGIQHAYKSCVTKKPMEESPDWFRSPPKTCVLLEPFDDQTLDNGTSAAATNYHLPLPLTTGHVPKINVTVSKEIDSQVGNQQAKTTRVPEPLDGNLSFIESTPIWKEPQSEIRIGKHPGENTLKKELWTKFEAASTDGLRFNFSVVGETSQKGFLDRLEEVSSDGEM